MSLNTNRKYKLIFNPKAGVKRGFFFHRDSKYYLEQVQYLLQKYQIDVDFSPTKKAGHAIVLARDAVKEGYKGVLVAGGDGTVGEVANGLIGSDLVLGIIPLGSFMNTAKMLSVPVDLEQAVMLVKIGRVRKIDAGKVMVINGVKLEQPYYFLESSSMGLEAQAHEYINQLESGRVSAVFKMIKSFFDFYLYSAEVTIDGQKVQTKASAIVIGNGELTGPGLPMALNAKLNDHLLTVIIYKMTKFELIRFVLNIFQGKKDLTKKVQIFQGKNILLTSRYPRLVHADARIYGKTPLECEIEPNALNIIVGFPGLNEEFLKKTTPLDP